MPRSIWTAALLILLLGGCRGGSEGREGRPEGEGRAERPDLEAAGGRVTTDTQEVALPEADTTRR